jgi:hypothetical protein
VALDGVELALVLDRRDPVGVRVDPGGPVGDDRAVVHAVPQGRRQLDELGGPLVATRVVRAVGQAEVAGLVAPRRGDDVPPGPPTAEVVERGEGAGQAVRVVVRRRGRRDEPDVLGRRRERGEQRQRLEGVVRAVPHGTGQRDVVGEEDRVEQPALRGAGDVDVVLQGERLLGPGGGVAPRGLVVPVGHEEGVEVELS